MSVEGKGLQEGKLVEPINKRAKLNLREGWVWIQFLLVSLLPLFVFIILFWQENIGYKMIPAGIYVFESRPHVFLVILFLAFLGSLYLLYLHNRGTNFHKDAISYIQLILRPLVLGALIGLSLSIVYLSFTFSRKSQAIEIDSMLINILGLYLASCGLTVAFWGIYGLKIPITDLPSLMEALIRDLRKCKIKLTWAFPGLSFASLSVGGEYYSEFYKEIYRIFGAQKITKRVYVLNQEEICAFYEPYIDSIKSAPKNANYTREQVGKAIHESILLLSHLKQSNSKHFVTSTFPYQIIMVDDAIYFLEMFGLPVKDRSGKYVSSQPKGMELIVESVATRLENSGLVNYLQQEIQETLQIYKTDETNIEGLEKIRQKILDLGYNPSESL